jgi:hypothetical protein
LLIFIKLLSSFGTVFIKIDVNPPELKVFLISPDLKGFNASCSRNDIRIAGFLRPFLAADFTQ